MSEQPIFRRTIVRHVVPSRYLPEGSRSIRLYLPPGYQEVLSYPVVYCQDGEDFFNFGRIATFAQKLILEDGWEPFIIVGVDVDKKLRTSEYAPGGERHERYVRFFAEELVPFVESTVAVRTTPDERLLAGDSLGAAVSLSIALARPDLFTRILSLSGAYYDGSVQLIQTAEDLSWLSVWMTVGLQENAYETDHGTFNFVQLNRLARRMFESRGAFLDYREKDGEHKWGFWQSELTEALAAFLGPEAHM
ncbi:alpha/beta hydrolase-fold protein [Cohnella lubricantis]|uniref:Esterase family protein n=1 Tax=Cohnella lubricantis TaxID=2163172 RepID=A0A841TA94_9BACL|nr:alpha/beta hydrolase-fold protein [Cohnella lubricantis]MBB6676180.1 esterase family protein [Cohnella lubricantis]MBP2118627.1 enterochelin esterase-like enzyme [Cohnella lubricantis]